MLLARIGLLICIGLAIVSRALAAGAQQKPARVAVDVVDESGAAVAKAQITFSMASEEIATETADDQGQALARLAPGTYELVVTSPGFRRFAKHMEVQDAEQVHVVLRVASCPPGPCLEVTGPPRTTTIEGADAGLAGPDPVTAIVPRMPGKEAKFAGMHYEVTLRVELAQQMLEGEEEIHFEGRAGKVEWQKQDNIKIRSAKAKGGEVLSSKETLAMQPGSGGDHLVRVGYAAGAGRGIRWFADGAGLVTAFYCEAWMVCRNDPGERATLRLEIVLPAESGLCAVGPGLLRKQWRERQDEHFLFEVNEPVQTYLFSFGIAKLARLNSGDSQFSIYTKAPGHQSVLRKTSDAYTFLRSKAGAEPFHGEYAQAFLAADIAQEAAGLALMSEEYLARLESKDDVALMAHELAHQWWGVSVGIRSWSDFWLNEGVAEFMADAYLERHRGRVAYDAQIAELRRRMAELREQGKDRPLHWEQWNDAHEALGAIPYVKGALFLDRLRTELGEEKFWRGIGLYTSRNAGGLVDSQDFERAMEEASERDLRSMFESGVFH
jgi:aminopeptidase N